MTTTLSNRLAIERHRAFVGRAAERELFHAAISTPSLPFNVLFIHGPGGIGKTTLLREFAYLCEKSNVHAGCADTRNIEPSPESFMDALSKASGLDGRDFLEEVASLPTRRVALVDTCEELSPLDGWMEETFFPRLPENLLIVMASTGAPPAAWRLDPGWHAFAKTICLGNLGEDEGREYLEKREVPEEECSAILDFTHGHPLALSLVADAFSQRPGYRFRPETSQDAIRTILDQFVRHVPGPAHRAALESCALVRHTTEAILQKMLSMPDVHELFDWLRGLAFIECGSLGLFIGRPEPFRGPEGAALLMNDALEAFPDLRLIRDGLVIEGDRAVLVWTARGTHKGKLMRIPPTGREICMSGVSILTVGEAGITHGLYVWDTAGLLRNIGLLPEL